MLNWRCYPFVRLTIPFLFGIVVANYEVFSNVATISLTVLAGISCLFMAFQKDLRPNWLFGLGISIFLFFVGALRFGQQNDLKSVTHFSNMKTMPQQIVGWVANTPEHKKWTKLQLRVTQGNIDNEHWFDCDGKLMVYLAMDERSKSLKYGDMIWLEAFVQEIPAPKNPYTFDYKKYLFYKNIYHQTFIQNNQWTTLEAKAGAWIWHQLYVHQSNLLNLLRQHLTSEASFAIGASLILGYRNELSEEVRQAYVDAGAIHILAVSGLHVGIIYFLMSWILKIIPFGNRWIKVVCSLLGIWIFALLTGASPSVLRAATMFSFIIVGQYLYRGANVYNNLAAAAFCTLLVNPYLLLDVGFQLSYLAVFGIVFFQPKIYTLIDVTDKGIIDYFWQIFTVSIAAQMLVTPISLYYFHQFPTYFWLSSLVVIPAAAFILSCGLGLFAFSSIPFLNTILGYGLYGIISLVNQFIFFIQNLPSGKITNVWLATHEVVLLYAAIAAVMFALESRQYKHWLIALGCFAVFLISRAAEKIINYTQPQIVLYDAGQYSIIDFFDGKIAYTTQSSDTVIDMTYTSHPYRSKMRPKKWINISTNENIITANCMKKGRFIQFYHQRMVVLNDNSWAIPDSTIKVDYIVLTGNKKISLDKIKQAFDFEWIVADATNHWKTIQPLKLACEQSQTNFYDISQQGAFVVRLKALVKD